MGGGSAEVSPPHQVSSSTGSPTPLAGAVCSPAASRSARASAGPARLRDRPRRRPPGAAAHGRRRRTASCSSRSTWPTPAACSAGAGELDRPGTRARLTARIEPRRAAAARCHRYRDLDGHGRRRPREFARRAGHRRPGRVPARAAAAAAGPRRGPARPCSRRRSTSATCRTR